MLLWILGLVVLSVLTRRLSLYAALTLAFLYVIYHLVKAAVSFFWMGNAQNKDTKSSVEELNLREVTKEGLALARDTRAFVLQEDEVRVPVSSSSFVTAIIARPQEDNAYSNLGLIFTHPWAVMGGDLDNNVPSYLSRTFGAAGFHTCRLDFRGFGVSRGNSEMQDIVACMSYMRQLPGDDGVAPPSKFIVVGYSYGSISACAVGGEHPGFEGFVGIGIPFPFVGALTLFNGGAMFKRMRESEKPKLLIMGDNDAFASASAFRSQVAQFSQPLQACLLRGADHFWFGNEAALYVLIFAWLEQTFFPKGEGDGDNADDDRN